MSVLIACEESATVRDAFNKAATDAWSCDLLPSRGRQANHLQGDIRAALDGDLLRYNAIDMRTGNQPVFRRWSLVIAHPPCTATCVSGNRWYSGTQEREDGLAFVRMFFDWFAAHPDVKGCVEQPISIVSSRIRKPDQIVQPWQFGHGEIKATCFWLFNGLPKLTPTKIVKGRVARVHRMPPGEHRSRDRAATYQGIADAMADQWRIYA